MKSIGVLLVAFVLIISVSGCAAPSQSKAMVAVPSGEVHHNNETVSVTVTGGRETSGTGASQISDKDFARALRESIEKSGLFAKAIDTDGGRYRLDAYIGELAQPVIGFDMTASLEVAYTLTQAGSQKVVWKKSIRSIYTATTKDSAIGATRLELANEGAARKNIEQVITELSNLNLE
jgi:hypothetical protein